MNGIFEFAVFQSHHAGQWTMHKVKNLARGPNLKMWKLKKDSKRCCWWPTLGRAGPPATGSQFANLCVTKDHNWPWHQSVTSDIQGICDVWDFCEIYVSETILPSGGKRSWCSRPEWNAQSQPRGRACKNLEKMDWGWKGLCEKVRVTLDVRDVSDEAHRRHCRPPGGEGGQFEDSARSTASCFTWCFIFVFQKHRSTGSCLMLEVKQQAKLLLSTKNVDHKPFRA